MTKNLLKYIFKMCLSLLFISCIFSTQTVSAQDLSFKLSSTVVPVVEDKADIFTDYEEVTIHNEFTKLRDETGYQYIFMTVTDTIEYARGHEVEAMYNSVHGTLYGNGSVLFLISTDEDNLICEIQAYSYARDFLSFEVCDYINKQLRPYVENKDYMGCMNAFFDYYNQAYEGTLNEKNITAENNSTVMSFVTNKGVYLIISLFISLAFTLIIIFSLTKKLQPKSSLHYQKPFVGPYSLKSTLTTDRLTYIRSRISK